MYVIPINLSDTPGCTLGVPTQLRRNIWAVYKLCCIELHWALMIFTTCFSLIAFQEQINLHNDTGLNSTPLSATIIPLTLGAWQLQWDRILQTKKRCMLRLFNSRSSPKVCARVIFVAFWLQALWKCIRNSQLGCVLRGDYWRSRLLMKLNFSGGTCGQ